MSQSSMESYTTISEHGESLNVKMGKDKRVMVRFDESTFMALNEVAIKMKTNLSVVIRAFCRKQISDITDTNGNIILHEKRTQSKQQGVIDDS